MLRATVAEAIGKMGIREENLRWVAAFHAVQGHSPCPPGMAGEEPRPDQGVIGATRSGKSRRIILPTIWVLAQTQESMIITDPKGALYHMVRGYLKRQDYEVILIDLRQPLRGNKWNPLLPVVEAFRRNDVVGASQAAWDIAHIITHQYPHYGDPIWPQAQESLTAALALAVADYAPEQAKHLASAFRMLSELGAGGGEELDGYFRRLP